MLFTKELIRRHMDDFGAHHFTGILTNRPAHISLTHTHISADSPWTGD